MLWVESWICSACWQYRSQWLNAGTKGMLEHTQIMKVLRYRTKIGSLYALQNFTEPRENCTNHLDTGIGLYNTSCHPVHCINEWNQLEYEFKHRLCGMLNRSAKTWSGAFTKRHGPIFSGVSFSANSKIFSFQLGYQLRLVPVCQFLVVLYCKRK